MQVLSDSQFQYTSNQNQFYTWCWGCERSSTKRKGRGLNQPYDDRKLKLKEKKEEIWLSPMTKVPTPTEKSKSNAKTQKCHQKLRVHNGWSNGSHPTGVFKPVYGISTFPLTAKAVQSKGHIEKCVNNPPYKDRGPRANQSEEAIKIIIKSDSTKTQPKTSITQRLRTVSWSTYSYPIGVVKPVLGR